VIVVRSLVPGGSAYQVKIITHKAYSCTHVQNNLNLSVFHISPLVEDLAFIKVICLSCYVHRKKKVQEFLVPSRDVTTKLSRGGNNDVITELFLPRGSLISDIPAGDGKLVNHFLRCMFILYYLSYHVESHIRTENQAWDLV
jgi:hypothetical protein